MVFTLSLFATGWREPGRGDGVHSVSLCYRLKRTWERWWCSLCLSLLQAEENLGEVMVFTLFLLATGWREPGRGDGVHSLSLSLFATGWREPGRGYGVHSVSLCYRLKRTWEMWWCSLCLTLLQAEENLGEVMVFTLSHFATCWREPERGDGVHSVSLYYRLKRTWERLWCSLCLSLLQAEENLGEVMVFTLSLLATGWRVPGRGDGVHSDSLCCSLKRTWERWWCSLSLFAAGWREPGRGDGVHSDSLCYRLKRTWERWWCSLCLSLLQAEENLGEVTVFTLSLFAAGWREPGRGDAVHSVSLLLQAEENLGEVMMFTRLSLLQAEENLGEVTVFTLSLFAAGWREPGRVDSVHSVSLCCRLKRTWESGQCSLCLSLLQAEENMGEWTVFTLSVFAAGWREPGRGDSVHSLCLCCRLKRTWERWQCSLCLSLLQAEENLGEVTVFTLSVFAAGWREPGRGDSVHSIWLCCRLKRTWERWQCSLYLSLLQAEENLGEVTVFTLSVFAVGWREPGRGDGVHSGVGGAGAAHRPGGGGWEGAGGGDRAQGERETRRRTGKSLLLPTHHIVLLYNLSHYSR